MKKMASANANNNKNKKRVYCSNPPPWTKGFRNCIFTSFILPILFYLFTKIDSLDESLLELIGSLFLFFSISIFVWGITLRRAKKSVWKEQSHLGLTISVTLAPLALMIFLYVTF